MNSLNVIRRREPKRFGLVHEIFPQTIHDAARLAAQEPGSATSSAAFFLFFWWAPPTSTHQATSHKLRVGPAHMHLTQNGHNQVDRSVELGYCRTYADIVCSSMRATRIWRQHHDKARVAGGTWGV